MTVICALHSNTERMARAEVRGETAERNAASDMVDQHGRPRSVYDPLNWFCILRTWAHHCQKILGRNAASPWAVSCRASTAAIHARLAAVGRAPGVWRQELGLAPSPRHRNDVRSMKYAATGCGAIAALPVLMVAAMAMKPTSPVMLFLLGCSGVALVIGTLAWFLMPTYQLRPEVRLMWLESIGAVAIGILVVFAAIARTEQTGGSVRPLGIWQSPGRPFT